MLIAWDNLIDDATISAGSEVASLPGSNVQHPLLSRKWFTAEGVVTSHLTFDLGESLSASLLAVLGSNLTPDATLRLRGSDDDATATSSLLYDSGTVLAGAKLGYGAAYKSFAAQAARYWRLDLSDASLPDNLQVGRVFLGPSWEISTGGANAAGGQLYDWSVTALDESEREESEGGQVYIEERPQRRLLTFTLNFMDEAEMYGNAFAMARANGVVRDVLVIPSIGGSYVSEQAVWGLIAESRPLVQRAHRIYQQDFQVKERL